MVLTLRAVPREGAAARVTVDGQGLGAAADDGEGLGTAAETGEGLGAGAETGDGAGADPVESDHDRDRMARQKAGPQ